MRIQISLKAQKVNLASAFENSLWCEVNLTSSDKLLIGYIETVRITVKRSALKDIHTLIIGDFCYKGVIWENWSTPGLSETSEEFMDIEAFSDN